MLLLMDVLMMVLMSMLMLHNNPVVIVAFADVINVAVTAAIVASILFSYNQNRS